MHTFRPFRPPQIATRRRHRANLPLIAAVALVLLVAVLAQPTTAFDFFQTFFGSQNQGQGQRDSSGDRQSSSATNTDCSDYICPLPSPSASSPKICVVDPRDCPCSRPALETKCPVGDWYTCVPNSIVPTVDGCKAYLARLNGPGAFGGADASGKRSEL